METLKLQPCHKGLKMGETVVGLSILYRTSHTLYITSPSTLLPLPYTLLDQRANILTLLLHAEQSDFPPVLIKVERENTLPAFPGSKVNYDMQNSVISYVIPVYLANTQSLARLNRATPACGPLRQQQQEVAFSAPRVRMPQGRTASG